MWTVMDLKHIADLRGAVEPEVLSGRAVSSGGDVRPRLRPDAVDLRQNRKTRVTGRGRR
jgi:hypothetical protein